MSQEVPLPPKLAADPLLLPLPPPTSAVAPVWLKMLLAPPPKPADSGDGPFPEPMPPRGAAVEDS